MRILIAAATGLEVRPLVDRLELVAPDICDARGNAYRYGAHDLDVLLTGVGMVATAAWCSRALTDTVYDAALNIGVCGAFDRRLAPGTVVHVVADRVCELGAEDDEQFLTIEELQLLDADERPFARAELVNDAPIAAAGLAGLPRVKGITVNTVHGNTQSIARTAARFAPDVESMEGAAFMYACMIHEVPFAQVRAVSNIVERRNKDAWRMADAIASLAPAVLHILDTL